MKYSHLHRKSLFVIIHIDLATDTFFLQMPIKPDGKITSFQMRKKDHWSKEC